MGHWSSCAVHNEPAYPNKPCDCGGLDIEAWTLYYKVVGDAPRPEQLAEFLAEIRLP